MDSIEQIRAANLTNIVLHLFTGSQTALAKALGHKRPTMVNHWIRGRKVIGSPSARLIEKALKLPENCLDVLDLGGLQIGRDFNWADHTQGANPRLAPVLTDKGYVRIEALDLDAYIGERNTVTDEEFGYSVAAIELSRLNARRLIPTNNLDRVQLLTLRGDVMAPTICSSDMIFVDTGVATVNADGVYVFRSGSSIYLRRIQRIGERFAIKADNDAYETWYAEEHTLTVIAQVISTIPVSAAKFFA